MIEELPRGGQDIVQEPTPQQWGYARVNAFIVKKKKGGLNHDKDLA